MTKPGSARADAASDHELALSPQSPHRITITYRSNVWQYPSADDFGRRDGPGCNRFLNRPDKALPNPAPSA